MLKKRTSLDIFISVIKAIFLREIKTRFGSKNLGYFWAIAEPMAFIIVFVMAKVMLFGRGGDSEYDFVVFIASGFLVFNLFKNIVTQNMNAFTANKALFSYKQVHPLDPMFARVLLEILIFFIITSIFVFIGWYFGYDLDVQSFNHIALAVIWIVILSFSWGLLFGVLGYYFSTLEKIIKLAMMPLMFLSALFYSLKDMPIELREILLYNPIIHFMEMIHGFYFEVLDDRFVDYTYMTYWTIIPLFIGLVLYIKLEKGIRTVS
ncbi:MAG: ABC transporter permease [Campylobacterota bacterium]|nr:ABC transporter permease [Campylobacterota bacterium]